jgi:uncharacterized protein (DUF433 family)
MFVGGFICNRSAATATKLQPKPIIKRFYGKNNRLKQRVYGGIILVATSVLYSNRLKSAVRIKKSLSASHNELAALQPPNQILSQTGRTVNGYGETEVVKIQQEQKHMSEEETKLLVEGYRCGKTTYQLARQFGCHRLTVSNALKRHGVNVTKCTGQRQLDAEDVIAMYGDMCTSAEIAEKYGVEPNVILRCLRKRGVRIRGKWEY